MKKICALALALISGFITLAQDKKVLFDKKFTYSTKMELNDSVPEELDIVNFFTSSVSKDALFESNSSFIGNPNYIIFSNGRYIRLGGITLDRKIVSYPDSYYYSFEDMKKFEESATRKMTFIKRDQQPASHYKFPCEYYVLDLEETNKSYTLLEDPTICFCIDTNSSTKNLRKILPNANIDGLVVAITDIYSEERAVYLKEIQNVSIDIAYDFNNEYTKLKDNYEAKNKQYADADYADPATAYDYDSEYYNDYYNDPICIYYKYFEGLDYRNNYLLNLYLSHGCSMKNADFEYDGTMDLTREQSLRIMEKATKAALKQARKDKVYTKSEIKEMEKVLKTFIAEAKAYDPKQEKTTHTEIRTDDPVTAEAPPYDYGDVTYDDPYLKYQSEYKTIEITDDITLAAEHKMYQYANNAEKLMPEYCSRLKESVPSFEDKNLYNHVYNAVGQICDLYLYQNGGDVDYIGTLNSLRKSLLEIENKREKMSKEDASLLKTFINALD